MSCTLYTVGEEDGAGSPQIPMQWYWGIYGENASGFIYMGHVSLKIFLSEVIVTG